MKRPLRHFARIALALLVALVLALLAAEGALRIWTPQRLAFETNEHRRDPDVALLTVDPELGFVPVLGGERFAPHGAQWNDYALEKPPGRVRLLFIGDSVTERGAIVNGLRAELGDERYEYWNAGVGGYATRQELGYYRRYCGDIRPDQVILTFHMNDFDASPVYFQDEGVVAVRASNVRRPDPWLWQYSIAYRLWFQWTVDKVEPPSLEERLRDLEGALAELRDLVHERGAELTVLVFPWLRPLAKWPGALPRKHELVLELLAKLGIPHHAFLDELEAALAEGVEVREKERDPQHPSPEFGRRIAHALVARGFAP